MSSRCYRRRSYPEHFVQREFSQLGAHGGLCQLCDCVLWVLHTVAGLPTGRRRDIKFNWSEAEQRRGDKSLPTYLERVQDSQVKHAVYLQRHIICRGTRQSHPQWLALDPIGSVLFFKLTQRDSRLLWHVDHYLLQTLHVADPVQDGNQEVQTLSHKHRHKSALLVSAAASKTERWEATLTGSRMRWKRPILSTTQASCWGTNSTTVFIGRLEAQRCWAGVTHNLGALRWLCCTQTSISTTENVQLM